MQKNCFCPLGSSLRPFYFTSQLEVLIFLYYLSLSEGMQYSVSPQFIDMNIDILCMYYMILLLMTDKYTELIFILLHFIYIHKYIYIKMFTIRFKFFFFTFLWAIKWMKICKPRIVAGGRCQCYLACSLVISLQYWW